MILEKKNLTLDQAPLFSLFEIIGFSDSKIVNPSFLLRLQEMGFTIGSHITLVSQLPFKGPLAFKIKDSKIAIRREDAKFILIKPCNV